MILRVNLTKEIEINGEIEEVEFTAVITDACIYRDMDLETREQWVEVDYDENNIIFSVNRGDVLITELTDEDREAIQLAAEQTIEDAEHEARISSYEDADVFCRYSDY